MELKQINLKSYSSEKQLLYRQKKEKEKMNELIAKNQQIIKKLEQLKISHISKDQANSQPSCNLSCDLYDCNDITVCGFCLLVCQQFKNPDIKIDLDYIRKIQEFDFKQQSKIKRHQILEQQEDGQQEEYNCQCDHQENQIWCQQMLKLFLEKVFIEDQNINSYQLVPSFNQFMKSKINFTNILEYCFKEELGILEIWKKQVESDNFNWNDVELGKVKKIINFLNVILPQNKSNNFLKASILDFELVQRYFDTHFIHKFIRIKANQTKFETDSDEDYNSSQMNQIEAEVIIKNKMIYLIECFFVRRIIRKMDKVDSLEIQNLSPISRIKIAQQNQNMFRLLSDNFNLAKLVQDCMNYMMRIETIPYIVKQEKIYTMQLVRYISEYKILSDRDEQVLQFILYDKYTLFQSQENLYSGKHSDSELYDQIFDNLQEARETYGSFILSRLFKLGDNDLLNKLTSLYNQDPDLQDIKLAKEILVYDNFHTNTDFTNYAYDYLLGYLLNQVYINQKQLISDGLYQIIDKIVFYFFSSRDSYEDSLDLLDYQDYKAYFVYKESIEEKNPKFLEINNNIQQQINKISIRLERIFNNFSQGRYEGYENKAFYQDMSPLLDDFSPIIRSKDNELEEGLYELDMYQNSMFQHHILIDMLNLIQIFDVYSNQDQDDKTMIKKFLEIIKYYLKESIENQTIFLQGYYYNIINSLFYDNPLTMSEFYIDIFENSSTILSKNYSFLILILEQFQKVVDEVEGEGLGKKERAIVMTNLLTMLVFFLKDERKSNNLQECDLIIQTKLEKILEFFLSDDNQKIIDRVIQKTKSTSQKLYKCIFILIRNSIKRRITYQFYQFLSSKLPLKRLMQLIRLAEEQIEIRAILFDIFDNIHLNVRYQIFDDRSMFISDQHGYYEHQTIMNDVFRYDIVIQFIIEQLQVTIDQFNKTGDTDFRNQIRQFITSQILICIQRIVGFLLSFSNLQEVIDSCQIMIFKLSFQVEVNYTKLCQILCTEIDKELNNQINSQSRNKFIEDEVTKKYLIEEQPTEKIKMHLDFIKTTILKVVKVNQNNIEDSDEYDDGTIKRDHLIKISKHKKFVFKTKNREKRIQNTVFYCQRFSNSSQERYSYLEFLKQQAQQEDYENYKNGNFIRYNQILKENYEYEKYRMLSDKSKANIFFNLLNQQNQISLEYSINFVQFLNDCLIEISNTNQNYSFQIIECLCHGLFLATNNLQNAFQVVIQFSSNLRKESKQEDHDDEDEELIGQTGFKRMRTNLMESKKTQISLEYQDIRILEILWQQLKQKMNYVCNKGLIDQSYKLEYQRLLMLIKVHHMLCEQNNVFIKNLFLDRLNNETEDNEDLMERQNTRMSRLIEMNIQLINDRGWDAPVIKFGTIQDYRYPESNSPELIHVSIYILDILSELCQGPNIAHQIVANSYTFDNYKNILKRNLSDPNSMHFRIKKYLIYFLQSILEGMDREIVKSFVISFDYNFMWGIIGSSITQMLNHWLYVNNWQSKQEYKQMFINNEINQFYIKQYQDAYKFNYDDFAEHPLIDVAVQSFILFNKVAEKNQKFKLFIDRFDQDVEETEIHKKNQFIYEYLDFLTKKVEIVNQKNKLEFYYFKVPNIAYFLSKEQKTDFIYNKADRTSSNSKLSTLLSESQIMTYQMQERYQIVKSNIQIQRLLQKKKVNFIWMGSSSDSVCDFLINILKNLKFNSQQLLRWFILGGNITYDLVFSILLLMAINLMIIYDFQTGLIQTVDPNTKVETYSPTTRIYKGEFETAILVLFIIVVYKTSLGIIMFVGQDSVKIFRMWLTTYRMQQDELYAEVEEQTYFQIYSQLAYKFIVFFVSQNQELMWQIFILINILLGQFVNVIFYGVSLLSITYTYESMRYVIMAILYNIKKLALVIIFSVILLFSFAYISNQYYWAAFSENQCDRLFECYLNSLSTFFINNEGVGSEVTQQSFDSINKFNYFSFLLFQLVFFFVINIMIINIIQALIVDIFTKLRNQLDEFKDDVTKYCYICNMSKYDFQKIGFNFADHQKYEHNIWDYLQFIVFMRKKTLKDCGGIELFLHNKISNNDISFFPQGRSISLDNSQYEVINHKNFQKAKLRLEYLKLNLINIQKLMNNA